MNLDAYTETIEKLLRTYKLSLFYMGFKPDGTKMEWWHAYRSGSIDGQGETPREAIIDLFKKI